eukprot:CAMPEP_0174964952 /NCGR_PEP_ID=MMETSP0004_2-20121128/6172_1 /TAXON_ID=420556 /ORGANISM="Ochromonas sp., Strain CCMP1393" /LENGTH=711 /DNA_ID=CAMNT_0016213747 /DNA_START=18 /DNA_END=2153 /DNA_ORIENTATION=+
MADLRRISTAGSMASSVSSVSMPELPNLPGVRRDISLINPKLYREFKASQSQESLAGGSAEEKRPTPGVAEENSLMDYFENGSKMLEYSQILSPYPSASSAYNDLGGRYSLVSQKQDRLRKSRSLPYTNTKNLPAFITNEGRVCTFLAYFTEVPRDGVEDRSRMIIIKIYLEDNSIEMCEPRVENSGTTQGKFLKRHQICKPNTSEVYTIDDVEIGAEMMIYNRSYVIIDASESTRKYMVSLGRVLGPALPLPDTTYDPSKRAGMTRGTTRQSTGDSRNRSYFQYDTKVLRFYGVWDCRDMLFGDEINVKLHYSLAENTIEVVPIHGRNSGRDRLPKLLKKTQIMKKAPLSPTRASTGQFDFAEGNGMLSEATGGPPSTAGTNNYNNDNPSSPKSPATRQGGGGGGSSPPRTSNTAMTVNTQALEAMQPSQPFHWTDLKVGLTLPAASMSILLTDADEFTREFYAMKNMPLDRPISRPSPSYPVLQQTIPPYNGFGSEEDSLQTCKQTLLVSAPSKDGQKMKLMSGVIMRYEAVLANPSEVDKDRKFIIQIHLEDDTFQIREPPIRNSGHKGGVFLARTKLETHDGSRPLQPHDVYLGAEVDILSHRFIVLHCDSFTFKTMEEWCNVWKYSDLQLLLKKIRPKKDVIQRLLLTFPGLSTRNISIEEMTSVLEKAGLNVVKQEVYTIFRAVDPARSGHVKMTQFLKFILDLQ